MNEFINGCLQGAKEAPLIFVAPLVAIWLSWTSTAQQLVDNAGR